MLKSTYLRSCRRSRRQTKRRHLTVYNLSVVSTLCNLHGHVGKRGNPFSAQAIGVILRNRTYIGDELLNGDKMPFKSPQIIPDDVFFEVQDLLNNASLHAGRRRKQNTVCI